MEDLEKRVDLLEEQSKKETEYRMFLQDSLRECIEGQREQTAGYQKTIRFVVGVCVFALAASIVFLILGLGLQYFKYAYMK